MKKIFGALMLLLVFIGLFTIMCFSIGLIKAVVIWITSIFCAAFIVTAIWLIVD